MKNDSIIKKLNQIKQKAAQQFASVLDPKELILLKAKYLGRRSELTAIFESIKSMPATAKKPIGLKANQTKIAIKKIISQQNKKIKNLKTQQIGAASEVNLDLPAISWKAKEAGKLHPVTIVTTQILDAMQKIGFEIIEGPDIETDYYNFEALNMPKHHPARDKWDTFYLRDGGGKLLLRTQTSAAQIRIMEKRRPPIKVAVPGKCYRHENEDRTHISEFYQIEALVVDKGLSIADLKGVLVYLFQELFSGSQQIRFRPNYFPYTEPSLELDLVCDKCAGKGCHRCGGRGIMEILGAGMVHPKVLQRVNIDPEIYSGYAFGLGPERIAMMKYGVSDLRDFYNGDLRYLKQF